MTCLVVLFCVVMYSRKYKIIFELKETLVQFCLSVTQERGGTFSRERGVRDRKRARTGLNKHLEK